MKPSYIHAIAALLDVGAALPYSPYSAFIIKERHPVPEGWVEIGAAAKSDLIELQVGIKQALEGVVEQHLEAISDPRHSRYGQYLSTEELRQLTAPREGSVDLIQSWLLDHDIGDDDYEFTTVTNWLSVTVAVEKAEQMLNTTYSVFRHEDGSSLIRAPEWSLPDHLQKHIDVVQPTTSFVRLRPNFFMTDTISSTEEAEAEVQVLDESAVSPGCISGLRDID